ncbi:MAG: hypothetical protein AB7O76_10470 [Rhizobiaceae bacterium]
MPIPLRPSPSVHAIPRLVLAAFVVATALSLAAPAFALSEIPQEEVPPPPGDEPIEKQPLPPVGEVPEPAPVEPPSDAEVEPPAEASPDDLPPQAPPVEEARPPAVDPEEPIPDVLYDVAAVPAPARRMRELIIEAARAGDLEGLRPLIGTGADITQLSFTEIEGDPIEHLRQSSGDIEGQEILAILQEVMEAGFVHLDPGTPEELYVWPYFVGLPLEKLDPRQRVELFKIVTAGDYEQMLTYGAYNFYRVGITPEGRWVFFVAGD